MTKKIICPSCENKIALRPRADKMVCPRCGRRLRIERDGDEALAVPALSFPEPPPGPEDELTVLVDSPRPVAVWLAVGVFLAAVALGVGICLWW